MISAKPISGHLAVGTLVLCTVLLVGCGLFRWKSRDTVQYPKVSYEVVHDRSGGLQPPDHCVLARGDEKYYYFEWRQIVEPATMKTLDGSGRVPVKEFDRKNGAPLERKLGILGKEDTNRQLYNAGVPRGG